MSLMHIKVRHCKWSAKRFVHDEEAEGPLTLARATELGRQALPCARALRISWVDKDSDYVQITSESDMAVAVAYAKKFQDGQLTLHVRRACTWPTPDQLRSLGFIVLATVFALFVCHAPWCVGLCLAGACVGVVAYCNGNRRRALCKRQPAPQQQQEQPAQPAQPAQVSEPAPQQPAQAPPQAPPQAPRQPYKFAEQMDTLKRLGFTDALRNAQALIAANGDVTVAVTTLLGE